MKTKFCLLFAVVFVTLRGPHTFGQDQDPNAVEVLRHYKESLSWQKTVSMKVTVESNGYEDGRRIPVTIKRLFTFRMDQEHARAEWSGKSLHIDANSTIDLDQSHVIKTIMNGDTYANLTSGLNRPPFAARIKSDKEFYDNQLNEMLCHPITGGPLWGKMYGNNRKSVAELLGESAGLTLRDEQENINGVPCYVLEATTEHGRVTAWLFREKGYNALKWSIQKTTGDLFNGKPISLRFWLAEFVADDLQKVGDFWVTTSGTLTFRIDYSDESPIKTKTTIHKYNVSDIQINPDFVALGAFKIDFPNGTRVSVDDYTGIRYVWQDGEIIPADDPTFDEIDKIVEELKQ